MVCVHLIYDLTEFYALVSWGCHPGFLILKNWGGVVFFLLSGICATLGTRELKRGALVLGCGILISAVTALFSPELPVRFGVLHCLGSCMILWHFLKKCTSPALAIGAAALIPAGLYFQRFRVETAFLFPLGLISRGFASADFFPLLPYLGFFLLGAVFGRRFYRERRSLLPRVNSGRPVIRFLLRCGRHSLAVYLLHQPVLMLILECYLQFALRRDTL